MKTWMSLCLLLIMTAACAEGDLASRLQALGVSFGADHTVTRAQGETWVTVGIREHVGFSHLQWANPGSFTARRSWLIPDRRLAQRHVTDGLVINLPELMVYHWVDGQVIEHYPVSVGMVVDRWHTPLGAHYVAHMELNPIFYWFNGRGHRARPAQPAGRPLDRPGRPRLRPARHQ